MSASGAKASARARAACARCARASASSPARRATASAERRRRRRTTSRSRRRPRISRGPAGVHGRHRRAQGERLEQHARQRLRPQRGEDQGGGAGQRAQHVVALRPAAEHQRRRPREAASNFSAWASEPSPSTTSGRPVRAAATAGTSRRAPLFSSSLPTKSRKRSGSGKRGRAAAASARASAGVHQVGDHLHARDAGTRAARAAMASLTARVAPARRSARALRARGPARM